MSIRVCILDWKVQVDAGKCPAQWLIAKVVSLDQTFLTNDPEQRSSDGIYVISDLSDLNEQIIKISKEREREVINRFYSCVRRKKEKSHYYLISLNKNSFKTNKTLYTTSASSLFFNLSSRIFYLKRKIHRKINKIVSKIDEILRILSRE